MGSNWRLGVVSVCLFFFEGSKKTRVHANWDRCGSFQKIRGLDADPKTRACVRKTLTKTPDDVCAIEELSCLFELV